MENVIVNVGVDVSASATATASRRSRLDDIVARHRQRRLESLAFWLSTAAVVGALLLV
jgi:hypothetical protein